jgi:hypothetical protein
MDSKSGDSVFLLSLKRIISYRGLIYTTCLRG